MDSENSSAISFGERLNILEKPKQGIDRWPVSTLGEVENKISKSGYFFCITFLISSWK